MALYVELSWPSCRISLTGPALRPGLWPNVAGTRVSSPVRRPSDLLTARQTTTLRPRKLLGLWPLLRRLMMPTFLLCRRLRCPSGLLAERRFTLFRPDQPQRTSRRRSEPRPGFLFLSTVLRRHRLLPVSGRLEATDPACVAASTRFRHTGFCSDTECCTVTLGRDPVVPIVAGVPFVDHLL